MRLFLKTSFLIIIFFVLSAISIYWWMHRSITPKLLLDNQVQLEVNYGDSAHVIGQKLKDLNLFTTPKGFSFASQIVGLHKELKAGVYSINKNETLASILTRISSGDGLHASITFIEGWTFNQVMEEIKKNPHINKTLDIENIDLLSERLALEFGLNSVSIEGWIFPDTYFFQYGASDQQLIRRAVWLQKKSLDEAWAVRSNDSKLLSPIDALNLASIIEKETQNNADRGLVSGVFHNRLAMKMRLQSDPTIIYGLGKDFDGNLKRKHLRTKSSYNSYLKVGLPPTPISNPGKKALLAAVQPTKTKALYFVAKGDGSSYFSTNFREHKKAVNYYQRGIGKPPINKKLLNNN